MQFQDINIEALVMNGLTTPKKRALISAAHMLIFLLLIAGVIISPTFAPELTSTRWTQDVFVMLGGLAVISIAHGLLFPKQALLWGKHFRKFSYLGYLDWRDNEIRARALREVARVSRRNNFSDSLKLVEFVPELGEYANLKMIAYQRRGLLDKYINSTDRLNLVCRFIYLSHVAELRQHQVSDGNEMTVF